MIEIAIQSLYCENFRIFSAAQAKTTVTEEAIRIAVFIAPTGTLSNPCGQ